LLTEKDIKSAAVKAGCGETTLHRWLKEDANFKAALHDAEKALIDNTVLRLATLSNKALDTLEALDQIKFEYREWSQGYCFCWPGKDMDESF
jgi:hypothetical protein